MLKKHQHEEHHSTLTVSVIEARGLRPRSGECPSEALRAHCCLRRTEIRCATTAGVVVTFQANQLPNPMVEILVPGHPAHAVKAKHTVNPRWDSAGPASYKRLSSDARVTVRIYDHKGRNHHSLLGESTISCSRLTGDKPMYIWLPLLPSATKRSMLGLQKRRSMPAMEAEMEEVPELQVDFYSRSEGRAAPQQTGVTGNLLPACRCI